MYVVRLFKVVIFELYLYFRKKLKEARLDATAMTHQINDNLKRITENEKQARDLGKTT